ncbi:alpha/beta fold hydrolase [Paenibacillus hunanensis]|uniref:Alpha-beta hydrolase superfamily lysophospholipase n=1 Tax=Paenibacillus hunanensis TaxID=539262 RepID=A0ABU1IYQ4_9BACL|nr:alpha/beta fold hydrolase [Paenibacillus hunanensis]MDR6244398.1 alpha-beta hydrolase superfamily lysophospholipase [Paenibacillus hunanensis]GGI99196.1 alpha/beta hydrolase [Paenibacillus hunanensis]
MQQRTFRMIDPQGVAVHVYEWLPDHMQSKPGLRGVIQLSHGMSETAARYARLAAALTEQGYAVYANDHRGHGQTAASLQELGDPGEDGFYWMGQNLSQLSQLIRQEHPGLPLFLLGHSMGSFVVQQLMYRHPEEYDGFILSGSNGPRGLLSTGARIAELEHRLRGPLYRSPLLHALVFGPYNRGLPRPRATRFDWLSRDPGEVAQYVNDPYCAKPVSVRFYVHFFRLLMEIHRPEYMQRIPKQKPIYLFSGDRDPVGLYGKGVQRLYEQYRKLDISDVELKLYPGARHETLNDINRDEVTADLLHWLERHCAVASAATYAR